MKGEITPLQVARLIVVIAIIFSIFVFVVIPYYKSTKKMPKLQIKIDDLVRDVASSTLGSLPRACLPQNTKKSVLPCLKCLLFLKILPMIAIASLVYKFTMVFTHIVLKLEDVGDLLYPIKILSFLVGWFMIHFWSSVFLVTTLSVAIFVTFLVGGFFAGDIYNKLLEGIQMILVVLVLIYYSNQLIGGLNYLQQNVVPIIRNLFGQQMGGSVSLVINNLISAIRFISRFVNLGVC